MISQLCFDILNKLQSLKNSSYRGRCLWTKFRNSIKITLLNSQLVSFSLFYFPTPPCSRAFSRPVSRLYLHQVLIGSFDCLCLLWLARVMSPLQLISQVVQTPQELERKKRNGTARQVRQEKNSFFPVFCFLTFGMDRLGKIRRHQWKERLKISKLAKIESDSS